MSQISKLKFVLKKHDRSFCITRLPLAVSDPKERLKSLDKQREAIIHSTIPLLNLVLVPLVGALPTPVIQWATKRKATTIMMYAA